MFTNDQVAKSSSDETPLAESPTSTTRWSPDSGSSGNDAQTTQEQPASSPSSKSGGKSSSHKGPRFYRVKPGDTPTSIASKTGVSLTQIEQLNPDIDPQTLNVGDRIKLRK